MCICFAKGTMFHSCPRFTKGMTPNCPHPINDFYFDFWFLLFQQQNWGFFSLCNLANFPIFLNNFLYHKIEGEREKKKKKKPLPNAQYNNIHQPIWFSFSMHVTIFDMRINFCFIYHLNCSNQIQNCYISCFHTEGFWIAI